MRIGYALIFLSTLLSGCSNTLVKGVYTNTKSERDYETAFIVLANIEVPMTSIEEIENDYLTEDDSKKRYYYSFLLSKSTQEKKYTDEFISSSLNFPKELSSNNTNWIGINSLLYEHLSIYGYSNDQALLAMINTLTYSDSANTSSMASDLYEIYLADEERFSRVARTIDFNVIKLEKLIEGKD